MFFSLEALKAKKGDCLLVHFGTSDQPTLLVIDGGPSGVYRQSLQKRLKDLQLSRAPDGSLDIHLMLVSHIDDDHIKGILDLTRELRESRAEKKMPMCKVKTLWHNSFDDVVGNHVDTFIEETQSDLGAAAINGEFTPDLALDHPEAAMLVASVPQGRQLRDDAKLLEFVVNKPFDSIVEASGGANIDPPLATGLDVVVVGPTADRVEAFQEKWDKELKKRNLDQPDTISAADYLDDSVWNLASIVVLLRSGDKEILLTGDGRGDYILEGMEDVGLFENGKRHISILKVPHHGSSNNVEPDFFERITADHYVISGDGSHGNPNVETLKMIFDARQADSKPFTIHLTYPVESFKAFRGTPYPVDEWNSLVSAQKDIGREFEIRAIESDQKSVKIDLLEPFA